MTSSSRAASLEQVRESVYDAAGGMPALVRLAHAWHQRCLADPVVGHAFSHGFHPDHTERLAQGVAEVLTRPHRCATRAVDLGDKPGPIAKDGHRLAEHPGAQHDGHAVVEAFDEALGHVIKSIVISTLTYQPAS